MDELLELLEDIKPTVDFRTCTGLIDDGYLDSFDILSIVSELNDAFGIEISLTVTLSCWKQGRRGRSPR